MILKTACDLENQRVVRADAERTRGSENLNKDHIELLLTLYCKWNYIKYKQGLNEVTLFLITFLGTSTLCIFTAIMQFWFML